MQVLLFGVELVVDAVNCSHQSAGSNGGRDEKSHFGMIFVYMSICEDTNTETHRGFHTQMEVKMREGFRSKSRCRIEHVFELHLHVCFVFK